jgi:hypothetical protein
MNLSGLSNSQIEQAIAKMQKGIEIKPNSPESAELQISIDRALEELKRRGQKKSDELPGNTGQLEQKPDPMYQPITPKEKEGARFHKFMEEKPQNIERVLVATLEPSQVVQVPVVQITLRKEKVFEREGKRVKETFEVKEQMTQSEILTMLKTYFKTLVNSENWKAGRYTEGKSGNMGFNVFELFKGWNAIHKITNEGDEYPPVNEVYPGYRHTSQDQRVGAELLHRWATNQQ